MDITHKHAGHLIVIEDQPFKANDSGMWDLTDIWRILKLPKGKSPAQWRTNQSKRLEAMQNLHSSNGSGSWATKRATLAYAAWVSEEFETMVYDAFEAILEMPEIAQLVAIKMQSLGKHHSAEILQRQLTENQERNVILRGLRKGPQKPRSAEQKERERLARMAYRNESRARKQGDHI
ncbi:KilA-N domain-containing protein [Pseudomonas moorei]|uniref:KilA-N domain-containing protein n=1 Tax=Pseudomonas moorei TaxID=395599 RepID=UPI00200CD87A|nr:KilA-N domain-containing protein [Pseudomonas moorei]